MSSAAKSTAAQSLAIAVLLAAGALTQIGCRACCSPHDYSGPVVSCECDSCGSGACGDAVHGRKGSVSGHFVQATPSTGGEPTAVAELPAPLEGTLRR